MKKTRRAPANDAAPHPAGLDDSARDDAAAQCYADALGERQRVCFPVSTPRRKASSSRCLC
jgi:hypothetical protein